MKLTVPQEAVRQKDPRSASCPATSSLCGVRASDVHATYSSRGRKKNNKKTVDFSLVVLGTVLLQLHLGSERTGGGRRHPEVPLLTTSAAGPTDPPTWCHFRGRLIDQGVGWLQHPPPAPPTQSWLLPAAPPARLEHVWNGLDPFLPACLIDQLSSSCIIPSHRL